MMTRFIVNLVQDSNQDKNCSSQQDQGTSSSSSRDKDKEYSIQDNASDQDKSSKVVTSPEMDSSDQDKSFIDQDNKIIAV